MHIFRAVCAVALLVLLTLTPAQAATSPQITDTQVTLKFPESITFSATASAERELREIVLEYGVDLRTCGTVSGLAFLEFPPGASADVSWTWDMRQSGSLPPGATIWYRWRVTDASGAEQVGEQRRVSWLDDTHDWQSLSRETLTLHWYEGDEAFATALLDSASESLARLGRETGVAPQRQVHVYVYNGADDLREAVLYEPGWTGGLAYSDHSLTIIGVEPDALEWGKRVTAHELTHVLVGDRAFSCVGSIPTWLNEGIAVYGEGGPEPYSLNLLQAAIDGDTLLSVRSLSGGFSEDPQQADLSYVQSYSIVRYLIVEHGQERLLALFDQLAAGDPIDAVLQAVYGFGIDGLEDRWRASVGAQPRAQAGLAPTATLQPAPIATIVPVAPASAHLAVLPTSAVVIPTPAASAPAAPESDAAPLSTWLAWAGLAGALLCSIPLLIGLVAGGYFLLRRKDPR
jgi:Peptidase MA superfamily